MGALVPQVIDEQNGLSDSSASGANLQTRHFHIDHSWFCELDLKGKTGRAKMKVMDRV